MSTEAERYRLFEAAGFKDWHDDKVRPAEPGEAGVYALLGDDLEPVYIGQSGNLPLRFVQHTREGTKTFSHIQYYHEPDLMSRLRLETIMIMLYLPKCNKGLNLGLAPGKIWEIKWQRSASTRKNNPRRRRRTS